MNEPRISRRRFLKTGAIAATLLAAGRLPLLTAEEGSGSGIDPSAGQHSVKPIRGYLARFSPAVGPLQDKKSYTLTYDIVHWNGADRQTGMSTNSVVGVAVITRNAGTRNVHYEIAQETAVGGVGNLIQARITCNEDNANIPP